MTKFYLTLNKPKCEDCPAKSKAPDSESSLVGVLAFELHSSHSDIMYFFNLELDFSYLHPICFVNLGRRLFRFLENMRDDCLFQSWISAHVWRNQVTLLRKVNMRKVISVPYVLRNHEKKVFQ